MAARIGVAEADLYDDFGITLRCPEHILASDLIGGGRSGCNHRPVCDPRVGVVGIRGRHSLEGKVDLIFDAGPTKYSKPSTLLKVEADRYQIVRQGVYDERIIDRLLRTTILFVCSGNTCRSPMAEALARRLLAEQLAVAEPELERKGISVLSAGSYALPGPRPRRRRSPR